MRKRSIVMLGLLVSIACTARTNPTPQEQVEMNKHLRSAKHAGAQPVVNPQKEVDKKTAQSKSL
ncbi:MAG TPA: hypothetical protein VK958_12925 [Methylophilus sp.]|uniref:hypothetical protein n=1 Tax=Methylophilus sp. TaxID=29541 RepID=UPI002BDEEDB6|nr:hypothetical protein [Methylophilus sp.]HSH88140.1 hypothetical protein [Methylophilus sp.]